MQYNYVVQPKDLPVYGYMPSTLGETELTLLNGPGY